MLTTYIQRHMPLLLTTLRKLCAIPAPSGAEEARAVYCKRWLEREGAVGVYIDEAQNAVLPLGCDGSDAITVVAAHTDTVFPDTSPMPLVEDDAFIRCPGVGDNTASVAVLLLAAKYFLENGGVPHGGVLFVWNSCEEGLGNLKGVRHIMNAYAGRVERFISLDCHLDEIATRCVGSHRYEVTVRTTGGHSYLAFGEKNAIAELSAIVSRIYALAVPRCGNSRTTYNVGEITGGTSVNTIAQEATMLCEYRSDNADCLMQMQAAFERIFEEARANGVDVQVTRIGERPCMGAVDQAALHTLIAACKDIVADVAGAAPKEIASSTDCNIPLSLGIPSVCIGVYAGGGMHTREEWVEKASLAQGLETAVRVIGAVCEYNKQKTER